MTNRISYSFKQDLPALKGAILNAQRQTVDLQGEIARSAATLQENWTGDAGLSWSAYQAQWNAACTQLVDALESLGMVVGVSSDDMEQAEAAARSTWH